MPIRLRLALWYGALAGLVVLVASLTTYAMHSRAHYADLDRRLSTAAEHAAAEYASWGSLGQEHLQVTLAVSSAPDVIMRIVGAAGIVVATSGLANQVPSFDPQTVLAHPAPAPFDPVVGLSPVLGGTGGGRGAFGLAHQPSGERWRVYVLPVAATPGRAPDTFFVAAAPLEPIDASVARFRQLVVLTSLLGAAVTLCAGWVLAGRALRPVAVMTETAGEIAHSRNFGRRVPAALVRPESDELGRLAKTFNVMLASLEQAYQAEQRFVSDASHELRTPLTAIQANLDLLERLPDLPAAERQEAVTEASREARRLTTLVAELLALARADAGVTLRGRRVELDRILLDAFAEARHLTCGQRLELAELQPSYVDGDADRLKQLLLILLDNAIKYTPPEGVVTVALRHPDGAVMAEVVVRDTGVGIAPAHLPHVFERFYRADEARGRDPGGSGLGLPIARWIAGQHHGDITLTSALGQGTTATVRLPVTH